MKYEINSKKSYHETMVAIFKMMDKGEENLSPEEVEQLSAMAIAAEKYEDEVLDLKPKKEPKTITEAVELKMFENRLSQSKLAEKLGLAKSKLSEILSGKRKPDIGFLKALHKELKIDAAFLLEHA